MSTTRTVVVEGPPRSTSMPSVDVRGSHFLASVSVSSPSPHTSHAANAAHPNRAHQTRTGMFLKKMTMLRHTRRKSEERRSGSMFPRQARSMELGNKPFGMSQPILGVSTEQQSLTDNEGSECSPTATTSPSLPNSRRASAVPNLQTPITPVDQHGLNPPAIYHANPLVGLPTITQTPPSPVVEGLPISRDPLTSSTSTSSGPASASQTVDDDLPASSSSIEGSIGDTESHDSIRTFHSAAESVGSSSSEQSVTRQSDDVSTNMSDSNMPPSAGVSSTPPSPISQPRKSSNSTPRQLSAVFATPALRSQSLPSRNLISPNTTPSVSGSTTPTGPSSTTPSTSGAATPKPLHPRLASLPAPMMARYATQGSVRLTPSIVHRQPPMPILNLPQLPPPTPPPSEAQIRSPVRLRSVPALPLRGPSEAEDADHENADLDEMEDVEEEEDEEENGDSTLGHASEDDLASSPSVEVPSMGRRLRSPLPPSLSRSPRSPPHLPEVDTSRLDVSFSTTTPGAGPSNPSDANRGTVYFTPTEPIPPTDILRTPIAPFRKTTAPGAQPHIDYFSSKHHSRPSTRGSTHDNTRTPKPADYHEGDFGPRTVPMPCASPRPGLYHQGSKSMVDLLSISRKEKEKEVAPAEKRQSHAPDYNVATTRDTPHAVTASPVHETPSKLRRQRSLPMYTNATEPPPYPSFQPRTHPVNVTPREEEGREQLPPYTNSIYLAAIMPRKMEFTAPGFQSRDRKWKRAYCVLEGTMFKVYKLHNGVVEDWWERTVGASDKTSIDPGAIGAAGSIRVSAIRESDRQRAEFSKAEASPRLEEAGPNTEAQASTSVPMSQSRSKLRDFLHPSRAHRDKNDRLGVPTSASRSRLSFDTPRDDSRSTLAAAPRRQSMDSARSGLSSSASSRILGRHGSGDSSNTVTSGNTSSTSVSSPRTPVPTPATSHFSSISTTAHEPEGEHDERDLMRKYTLQGAESGLASDYTKRKNVIRIRMEGEQFLLQAKDVPAVIEWIEGIQAATNVSLDLDERPMPKGPMFPRRRRRRPRRPEDQAQAQAQTNGSASANASTSSNPARAS